MKLKSRILPLAAGPALARGGDGGQVDVPPPEAVQTVYLEARTCSRRSSPTRRQGSASRASRSPRARTSAVPSRGMPAYCS